jgi:type II secretory pathway component GspD/PulD (secretin)
MIRRLPLNVAFCCLLTIGFAARPALAQQGANDVANKRVSIKFENISIQLALKSLFENAKVNYSIHPGIKGQLTANMTEVPFKIALENILRTVSGVQKLTYRVEKGVYHVFPADAKPGALAGAPTAGSPTVGAPIAGAPTAGSPAGKSQVAVKDRKVTIEFNSADLRTALASLFKSVDVNYVIENDVEGTVTASLKDVTFEVALKHLLKSAGMAQSLTYRIEDSVYRIATRPAAP